MRLVKCSLGAMRASCEAYLVRRSLGATNASCDERFMQRSLVIVLAWCRARSTRRSSRAALASCHARKVNDSCGTCFVRLSPCSMRAWYGACLVWHSLYVADASGVASFVHSACDAAKTWCIACFGQRLLGAVFRVFRTPLDVALTSCLARLMTRSLGNLLVCCGNA